MIALMFIVILLVFWMAYEIAVGYFSHKRLKRLERIFRVERTQRYFAQNRIELMNLAIEGKVDVNSFPFRFLYNFNTMLMRRPEQYDQISATVKRLFMAVPPNAIGHEERLAEMRNAPIEVRELFSKTADALGCLTAYHSRFWRLLFFIRRHPALARFLRNNLKRLTARLADREERKSPIVAELRNTQRTIHRMASA